MTADSLFREGENCWCTSGATRFGWMIDGEAYFRAVREAIGRAEREILIVGWDIDSRTELIRDEDDPLHPSPLADTLEALSADKPDLAIYVLSWDFAVIYVLERELMPARSFGWREADHLHFKLDAEHVPGASHHQKIVIVDGAVAFSGGLDLTRHRWDTRAHAADDPARRDPAGNPYRPFHDIQAAVAGPAAWRLRELVDFRWQNAAGHGLPSIAEPEPSAIDRLWPESVEVRGEDVSLAIARTWCAVDDGEDIAEVESLYLDMIAAADRHIYIENQYFTSPMIADALAKRLAEDDGPELVMILPGETSGWLEQATMDVLRNQALAKLFTAGDGERLRVLSPHLADDARTSINVHGKIMVVDEHLVRIGSANLSRRSMRLDSECDLVFEAPDAAAAFQADLLAEHLEASPDEIAKHIKEHGLVATVDAFIDAGDDRSRQLVPLETDGDDIDVVLEPLAKVADLERPIVQTQLIGGDTTGDTTEHTPVTGWIFLGVAAAIVGFWVYWAVQGAGGELDMKMILESVRDVASHPIAPVLALPGFVAGSLLVAPVTGMIALCALVFDPWVASVVALAGTLASTAVNYWLGQRFHATLMQRVPDKVTDRIAAIAESSDMWSLAGLRLIPIAPFTIVNVVVGASGIRLRAFLAGTFIAMTPGIVLICMSIDRARAALAGEPVFDPWIVAAIAGAGIALIGLRTWKQRRRNN